MNLEELQASIDKVKELEKSGKLEIYTKYQLDSVNGEKILKSIEIKHDDESLKEIKTDYVLGFFGLIMKLGPIARMGFKFR